MTNLKYVWPKTCRVISATNLYFSDKNDVIFLVKKEVPVTLKFKLSNFYFFDQSGNINGRRRNYPKDSLSPAKDEVELTFQ